MHGFGYLDGTKWPRWKKEFQKTAFNHRINFKKNDSWKIYERLWSKGGNKVEVEHKWKWLDKFDKGMWERWERDLWEN